MASVTRTTTWSDNQVLTASALNGEFNNLLNAINITNADVSAGAGIAYSKLSLTGSILDADVNASAAIDPTKLGTTFTGKTFAGSVQTLATATDASSIVVDLSTANIYTVTLTASGHTFSLSGDSVGQCFIIRVVQDATGSRTVNWFTTIKWAGGVAPTLTTTANKIDVFGFICTSSGNYDGYIVGQNL